MKITLNNEKVDFSGTTLGEMITSMGIDTQGMAVAVGVKIVPAAKWEEYTLAENDNITIIRATQGG